MKFKIKDKELFPIPNNEHMLHLATISYGLREFVVMACIKGEHSGKCYIEEVVLNSVDYQDDVFANFKFIYDCNLVEDLFEFANEHKLLDMKERFNELGERGKFSWLTQGTGSKNSFTK